MYNYFSHVNPETGDILAVNIRRGSTFQGKRLGALSPNSTYASMNLYPIIGTRPTTTETQRITGPTYEWDADSKVVRKVYTIVEITMEERIEKRKADLASLRYEKETAGIILNGQEIPTERTDQAMLNSAYTAVLIDPFRVIDWKTKTGWVKVDAATITAIAKAVIAYVQACFSREYELSLVLTYDIDTDITTGWPERIIE